MPEIALAETDFHAFNQAVWNRLSEDPELAKLDFRIETDKHGQAIISPPPAPSHGKKQSRISFLLQSLRTDGEVISECPISTSEGVKAADNVWCSDEVWQTANDSSCFIKCPELCVEVISPSNTKSEISEKKRLYFECGAKEVWTCDLEGSMTFYQSEESVLETSELFPEFPGTL